MSEINPYQPLDEAVYTWLTAPDGHAVRTAGFYKDQTRGAVALVTGRTEYIEKYARVIDAWGERGFHVYAMDWRGQGLSPRPTADPHKHHVESVAPMLSDLGLFLDHVSTQTAGLRGPLLLFGHSMGAHLALRWLADAAADRRPDGAVFTAPMVDIRYGVPKPVVRGVAAAATAVGRSAAYAPGQGSAPATGSTAAGARLTHDLGDIEAEARFLADHPAYRLGGVTLGWLRAILASIDRLRAPDSVARIDLPVLIALAEDDRVVSNRAARLLARRLPRGEVVTIARARHEIWRETPEIVGPFWAAIDRYITARGW